MAAREAVQDSRRPNPTARKGAELAEDGHGAPAPAENSPEPPSSPRTTTGGYDPLNLDNQLCFPLYAASRAVTRRYAPLLKELDLTYTQYITMMVLWECGQATVSDLGKRLHLDSGTLTPLLKKMGVKGLVVRQRSTQDERKVVVAITEKGQKLREAALSVPPEIWKCVALPLDEAVELRRLLSKILANVGESVE